LIYTWLSVFLCSFCVLALEISLTRTFSVLFRSPYVFLVVSVAVGGLGLGGMCASFRRLRAPADERAFHARLSLVSLLLALSIIAAVLILFATPLAPRLGGGGEVWVVILLPLVPFSLAGFFLASVFSHHAAAGGRLYFADLLGAAAACVAAIVLLRAFGGLNTQLLLACLAASSAFLLAGPAARRWGLATAASVVAIGAAALLGYNASRHAIDLPALTHASPDNPYIKPLFLEMADPRAGTRLVHTEWSTFARTDVAENAGTTSKFIWTDGDVPTEMVPFRGRLDDVAHLREFIGFLPYRLQRPERVLSIGPGGGLDVLLAILGHAGHVDAVEINPAIVPITERFREFYGDLYHRPDVSLFVEDGRSFVRRSQPSYDLIYMALAKTATVSTLGLALSENYLYTTEAFCDYLRHLHPDGCLALLLQEKIQIDRSLLTAVAALGRERGLSSHDASRHLVVLSLQEPFPPSAGPYRYLLLMRATPYTPETADRLLQEAQAVRLRPIFVPFRVEPAPYDSLMDTRLAPGELPLRFAETYPRFQGQLLDLSPATDDRPFYADFARYLHPQLAALLIGVALFSAAFVAAVLVWLRHGGAESATAGAREDAGAPGDDAAGWPVGVFVAYFAGLGIGFMAIEVVLIQKLMLFLGHPTRTLSVILFSLLLFGSMGSLYTQRWSAAETLRRVRVTALLLAVCVGTYSLILAPLLTQFLGWSLNARSLLTGVLLAPVGFLLGMPFPAAIRWLQPRCAMAIPALWGVNGVTSVLGSVLAVSLAKLAGYSATLAFGGAVYLGIAWLANRAPYPEPAPPSPAPPHTPGR